MKWTSSRNSWVVGAGGGGGVTSPRVERSMKKKTGGGHNPTWPYRYTSKRATVCCYLSFARHMLLKNTLGVPIPQYYKDIEWWTDPDWCTEIDSLNKIEKKYKRYAKYVPEFERTFIYNETHDK